MARSSSPIKFYLIGFKKKIKEAKSKLGELYKDFMGLQNDIKHY
jgi:hypothetical protein